MLRFHGPRVITKAVSEPCRGSCIKTRYAVHCPSRKQWPWVGFVSFVQSDPSLAGLDDARWNVADAISWDLRRPCEAFEST